MAVGTPREVPIRDDTIRLGQLLKLADLAESGSEAKLVLEQGRVEVNGEPEGRRGRQLAKGDIVTVGSQSVRIV